MHRIWRRLTAAGVDHILDYEVATLQALLTKLEVEAKDRLEAQLVRYDRIDRSPNKKYQRFIDDDSNFQRSDWPSGILFERGDVVHVADVTLRHATAPKAKVTAKVFLLDGKFDGCEFERSHTKDVPIQQYDMRTAMVALNDITTSWLSENVQLFVPLGEGKSSYKSVPA